MCVCVLYSTHWLFCLKARSICVRLLRENNIAFIISPIYIIHLHIYYFTGRFFKDQQKYANLIQLFTSAWRNKNTEGKGYILFISNNVNFTCHFSFREPLTL